MKIINNTSLNYEQIGTIIDMILNSTKGNTNYYGKVEYCTVEYKHKNYRIQIRYLKSFVEWRFDEE